MLTDDKVTTIFCIADDSCKIFDVPMAKYTIKMGSKYLYHRASIILESEIMVIFILLYLSCEPFYENCMGNGGKIKSAKYFFDHLADFIRTQTRGRTGTDCSTGV